MVAWTSQAIRIITRLYHCDMYSFPWYDDNYCINCVYLMIQKQNTAAPIVSYCSGPRTFRSNWESCLHWATLENYLSMNQLQLEPHVWHLSNHWQSFIRRITHEKITFQKTSFTLNVYFCLFNKKFTALKIGQLKKIFLFSIVSNCKKSHFQRSNCTGLDITRQKKSRDFFKGTKISFSLAAECTRLDPRCWALCGNQIKSTLSPGTWLASLLPLSQTHTWREISYYFQHGWIVGWL